MVTNPIPTFIIVTKSNGVCNPPLVHVATVTFAMASSTDRLIPLSSIALLPCKFKWQLKFLFHYLLPLSQFIRAWGCWALEAQGSDGIP